MKSEISIKVNGIQQLINEPGNTLETMILPLYAQIISVFFFFNRDFQGIH